MGIIFWGQLFTILKLLGNSTNIYKLLLIVFWWWIRKQSPSFLSHSPQSLPVVNYLVLLITYFSLPIWIFRFSFISGTFFFSCYLSLNNFDSIFYSLPHGSKLFFTNYYILSLIVSFCISLLFQDFFLSYDLNFKPLLFSYSWFPTHFTVKNRLLASVLQYQDRAWRLPLHPNKR